MLWRPSRLDLAPLALRHPREQATFRVAAASISGFRAALDELGFTEIQTPKIVASATESGANVFAIDYFGRAAYLAQSPQFYKQAMVGVFERVYETGPVFRAEPHDTRGTSANTCRSMPSSASSPTTRTSWRWPATRWRAWPRASSAALATRPRFFGSTFRGPRADPGSGQRLHQYEDYLAALAARGEDPLAYESYLQPFRYGMPPHGGFAIGLERWVSRLTGALNVRETTLFPRDRNRLTP